MKTPFLDKMIDDLQNHIESVKAGSYAGIPETRKQLAELEAIKEQLTIPDVMCSHEKTTKHIMTGIRYCSNPKCHKLLDIE